jgi:probable biosynthetic protein (TIGR04098 family)
MTDTLIEISATDAAGLSENWLLRRCGDLHWRRVHLALGAEAVPPGGLLGPDGGALYPTFVAIRCRYDVPFCEVRLGDRLASQVAESHFGRTFFHGRVTFARGAARLVVELLTTFTERVHDGSNELHRAEAPGEPGPDSNPLEAPPPLLTLAQAVRHGDLSSFERRGFRTPAFARGWPPSASGEPSPYVDFNGVGLLYFAAYPTLADALERRIVRRFALADDARDWASATSTVARDVFYHRNLDLGQGIVAQLVRFDRSQDRYLLHTVLSTRRGGIRLADVFTVKQIIDLTPRPPATSEGEVVSGVVGSEGCEVIDS